MGSGFESLGGHHHRPRTVAITAIQGLTHITTYSRDIRLGGESVAIVGIVCAQLVFSDSEAGSISPFSHIQISHGVLMQ